MLMRALQWLGHIVGVLIALIVVAVRKCQSCHGDNYAGMKLMDDAVFAKLSSSARPCHGLTRRT